MRRWLMLLLLLGPALPARALPPPTYPGTEWQTRTPDELGLDAAGLAAYAARLGGDGVVVRNGYLVYQWGSASRRGDVASACKPFYTHFLLEAIERGLLGGVDDLLVQFEPRLQDLNPALGHKDRLITWRHLANQVSCYGVVEQPGQAFDYSDYNMALFFDTLFLEVYGSSWERVDDEVLRPLLTDLLQCQDAPTFMVFGTGDRPGRVGISVRDFARFGLLYLNRGRWRDAQLLDEALVELAVGSPLSNDIPRTSGQAAEMIPGQRSIGGGNNQCDHEGSYSFAWWTNGIDRNGNRLWPNVPADAYGAFGHGGPRALTVIPSLGIVTSWNNASVNDWDQVGQALALLVGAVRRGPLPGQIVRHPQNPAWLGRSDGTPVFIVGPGDPEGFLYRGSRNPDGTRSGDQDALIDKLIQYGGNSIYMQMVRSHGGDGPADHNPFVDSDPARGLDDDILAQWEGWFARMDAAGIVIYLFFYDDGARIWNTGDAVGPEEQAFVQAIVDRFEHHRNLMWVVGEESEEAYSSARVRAIAAAIAAADDHEHVIANHHLSGTDFKAYADDSAMGQFAMQLNAAGTAALHQGCVDAFGKAAGRYNVVMSEMAAHGTGDTMRRNNWAAALGGAYVMVLGMDIAGTDPQDLAWCRIQQQFFESTDYHTMAPHDELAAGDSTWVLADPGRSYIAYSASSPASLGVGGLSPGRYDLRWLDCQSGNIEQQAGVEVSGTQAAWPVPAGLGPEVALWARRTAGGGNIPPTALSQQLWVEQPDGLDITLGYSDPDGPGPYTFRVVAGPAHGTLNGTGPTLTYQAESGFAGEDAFDFVVNDGLADSQPATIDITVDAAGNQPPVARDGQYSTAVDTPVAIQLRYEDADGPGPYQVTLHELPGHGQLSGAGNDRTYTPAAGFSGQDAFTWSVTDGLDESNLATVTITVGGGDQDAGMPDAGADADVTDGGAGDEEAQPSGDDAGEQPDAGDTSIARVQGGCGCGSVPAAPGLSLVLLLGLTLASWRVRSASLPGSHPARRVGGHRHRGPPRERRT